MDSSPADIDDAGIFALVVLASIAVAAGLVVLDLPLWLLAPACVVLFIGGEVLARQLAKMKARQEVEGS